MTIRKRGDKWLVELRPKGRPGIYATFDNKLDAQRYEAEQKILLKKGGTLPTKQPSSLEPVQSLFMMRNYPDEKKLSQ